MANLKISQLTGATTPLAGTEVLPVVQGGTTDQVSVANLTAGRAVSAASYTPTGTAIPTNGIYSPAANQIGIANNGVQTLITNASNNVQIGSTTAATAKMFLYANNSVGDAAGNAAVYLRQDGTNHIQTWAGSGGNVRGYWESAGDLVIDDTNIRFATAAKGINFTANTPAAGMTSELLNWYEEGTWTPVDSSGAGLSFTNASGYYTRSGNIVTLFGRVTFPATVSVAAVAIGGLPFTVANNNQPGGGCIRITDSGRNDTVVASAASTTITFYSTLLVNATNANYSGSRVDWVVTYMV